MRTPVRAPVAGTALDLQLTDEAVTEELDDID
jgi:hypothetical protein